MSAQQRSWDRLNWPPESKTKIFRDWAGYYTRKQRLHMAKKYYNMSLELKLDPIVMSHYSVVQRLMAKGEAALETSMRAATLGKKRSDAAIVQAKLCDALYDLNRLEDCKVRLHDNLRKYGGGMQKSFQTQLDVINENIKDTIGESLRPFILENENYFETHAQNFKEKHNTKERQLWKVLLEMGKCDVLSILEKEEIPNSPMELARRERTTKVLDQIYMGKNWMDILFLRTLKSHQRPVILPQTVASSKVLDTIMDHSCNSISTFLKMLKSRSPLYNEKMRKCPHKKVCDRFTKENFFRIQYQTRRNMMSIMRTIHALRAAGQVEKLVRFIENVMGDYVVLKNLRIMPWKFEFTHEVYTTLALAFADSYSLGHLPENYKSQPTDEQIYIMLHLKSDKFRDRGTLAFGDRLDLNDADISAGTLRKKILLLRLEKRMRFTQYDIEKAYLCHEIARNHLMSSHFEEACSVARSGVLFAKECNSFLWQFHCTLIIAKTHITLHKIERAKLALHAARLLSKRLQSEEIYDYIDYLCNISEITIQVKRRSHSIESMRRRKSMKSRTSLTWMREINSIS